MVLLSCGNGETSLKQIADMLGWNKGAASTVIRQLIDKGLLEKRRYGFYATTEKGHERIREIIKKDDPERNSSINTIVNRTTALFTADSHFDMIKTLKYAKESKMPPAHTKDLRDVIRKIYFETLDSVGFDHGDSELAKSIWRFHQRPACHCGFDFEKAYDRHENELKEITSSMRLVKRLDKKSLFRNLRWESFPDIEKYRRNFDLKTTITKTEIPESWNG